MPRLSFTVHGLAAPQGSKRVIHGRMVEDSKKSRPWRQEVVAEALQARVDTTTTTIHGPVVVILTFRLQRPKAHYRANGEIRADAPVFVPKKPDIDKLTRTILDALTIAAVIADDAQVAKLEAVKVYATGSGLPGVDVTVTDLHEFDRLYPDPAVTV